MVKGTEISSLSPWVYSKHPKGFVNCVGVFLFLPHQDGEMSQLLATVNRSSSMSALTYLLLHGSSWRSCYHMWYYPDSNKCPNFQIYRGCRSNIVLLKRETEKPFVTCPATQHTHYFMVNIDEETGLSSLALTETSMFRVRCSRTLVLHGSGDDYNT